MTRLAFDIYPAADPRDGARLVRLSNQHYGNGTYYHHELPVGSGMLVVEKTQTFVTATNFAIGNYVRVRDLDLNADDDLNVIGGFWLEEGDFTLVSDDPKVLRFGGPGTLQYIARAILGPESLSPFEGPFSIVDGRWRWGTDSYGGVLRRALLEANLQTPPGLPDIFFEVSGGVIIGNGVQWDDAEDSNGDPWPTFSDEYSTPVGTNLARLANDVFGFGLELEMDPHTFQLYAYNTDGMGTDRTSGTFATGKVRLLAGTNIAADLERGIHGSIHLTHLLVGTSDQQFGWIESDDYSPGDPVRKALYQTGDISGDPGVNAVIIARAQRNMDLRQLSEDAVRVPITRTRDDELNGFYQPGPAGLGGHVWAGDLVTLHTGALTTDYVNATKRVVGVSYELREGGDWAVILDLGARFLGLGSRLQGSVSAGGGVGCICPVPAPECADVGPVLCETNADPGGHSSFFSGDCGGSISGPGGVGLFWSNFGGGDRFCGSGSSTGAGSITPGQSYRFECDSNWTRPAGSSLQVHWLDNTGAQVGAAITVDTIPGCTWTHTDTVLVAPATADQASFYHVGALGTALFTNVRVTGPLAINSEFCVSPEQMGTSPFWARSDQKWPATSILIEDTAGDFTATDVEGALAELQADAEAHLADAADAHDASAVSFVPTGTIAATDVQAAIAEVAAEAGGVTDHGALTGLTDDDHTQYLKETDVAAKGDLFAASANDTVGVLTVGTNGHVLTADSGESLGVKWAAGGGGGGAPTDAQYVVAAANGTLSAEIVVTTPATGGIISQIIRKTADEVVNNSSALQNDDHLLIVLAASEVWAFEGILWYDAHASADLKAGWTFPAGATLRWMVRSSAATGAEYSLSGPGILDGTAQIFFGRGVGTMACATVQGVVINGANAGNLQLQWAQNTAHVSDSTLHDNSHLVARKLA